MITSAPTPKRYERVNLEKMNALPEAAWYQDAYKEFHKENPEFAQWVPATDSEELQQCVDDGMLYKVLIDGHHAGLVGGRCQALLGRSGVYMVELLIIPPFKRLGFAQALQRRFLDLLDPHREFIWGTIDNRNKASISTAIKIGRSPIRTEFFLPLD